MFNTQVLAHSGEEHEGVVESGFHYVEFLTHPVYAIILFALGAAILFYGLKRLHVSPAHRILVVLIYVFVVAILGLLFVPPLGIVALITGFIGSLVLSFAGFKQP